MTAGAFSIAVLGLTDSERRVVGSLCMLSRSRQRSYKLAPDPRSKTVDILIVDGEHQESIEAYETLNAARPTPALVVGMSTLNGQASNAVKRPIVASRLLNALDVLVTTRLGYCPELVIGENKTADAATDRDRLSTAIGSQSGASTIKALVVDDSPTIRKQIELALRLHRVDAVMAGTAEEAMQLVGSRLFNIIFLDVVLPGQVDGYQICRSIKKNPVHKGTPVIMLTGRSSAFDRVRGSLAGCDTYLTKPVDNQTFGKVLDKYLRPSSTILAAHV